MSEPKYVFPEVMPQHECNFVTDAPTRQKLYAKVVGVRLSTDRTDQPLLHLALRLEPGQQCYDAVEKKVVDVGGQVGLAQRYLTGGAVKNTLQTLKICGADAQKVREAYKADPQAVSVVQQTRAAADAQGMVATPGGRVPVDTVIDDRLLALALQRGDVGACGLGKVVLINSKEDSFITSKGEEIVTRKVDWIEAIPAPVTADAVMGLGDLFSSARQAPAGKAAPAGQGKSAGPTSAPPAKGAPLDDIEF